MRLSIVVPIYNVERYLSKCLDSLIAQDLEAAEYEIIVVDDCSPDGSRAIAETYAASHANIRIIEQRPNGGLAAARNLGLERSQGEYVLFVDSDDYLAPDSLGWMLGQADSERLDILAFRFQGVDEQGNEIQWGPSLAIPDTSTLTGADYFLRNEQSGVVPMYLYRRALLMDGGLRMLPGRMHEDEEFVPRAICLAARIRYYPRTVYYYLRREGSTVASIGRRNLLDLVACMASLARFARGPQVTDPRVKQALEKRVTDLLVYALRENYRNGYMEELELLTTIKAAGLMPLIRSGSRLRNCAPALYCALRKFKKRGRAKKTEK